MISFHMLGPLDLRGPEGRPLASPVTGAKRLALLAYLALAARGGSARRDTLVGLFWPEQDQRHARNSLSNMLHQIRRSLGADAVVTRGSEDVGLAWDALWCDAVAFEDALDEGRRADALTLYRGDLLEGLYVSGASPEFEQWLDVVRSRLRRRAAEAARAAAGEAERAGDVTGAMQRLRWLLRLEPYDERGLQQLLTLLASTGDRAGAVRAYEEFAGRLASELAMEPSPETRSIMETLRRRPDSPRAGELRPRCVAVLPFENLSGTTDAELFAAGLHDDLLTELSRIAALTVIARTSVLRFRGTRCSIPEIARELGAGTIVEGAVQATNGRIRLNVQLIDGRTNMHRWVERYDRQLGDDDFFDIQGELAVKIARTLEAELTPSERSRIGQETKRDLEAFRLCLQGRTLLDQRTEHDMRRSVDYYRAAIDRDGGYALAWAGMAYALALLEFYGYPAPDTAPDALWAAQRAVELGSELGETHAALGIVQSVRQNGPAALRALRHARRLAPSYADAHCWLGWVHLLRGAPEAALASALRGVELDPLLPAAHVYLAEAWLANGEPQRAAEAAVRTRTIRPEYGLSHYVEGLTLYHLGRLSDASNALKRARALVHPEGTPCEAEVEALLAVVHSAAGDRASADPLLERLRTGDHPFSAGLVCAALGRTDEALTAFEQTRDWASFSTEHFRYFFPDVLGPLRALPRYRALLHMLDQRWLDGMPVDAAG